MRLRTLGLMGILATLFSGCASLYDDRKLGEVTVGEINKMPIEQAKQSFENKTIMTFDPGSKSCRFVPFGKYGGYTICTPVPGHGTQVEYYSPKGRAFLWYPGNRRAVPSFWKLMRGKNNERYFICFLYSPRSYNPVTKESGGDWECQNLGYWVAHAKEVRDGDVFHLSTGRLPHTLSKEETTIEALLGKAQ